MLTNERLEEIAAYVTERGRFSWKDITFDRYEEHVTELIAEVRRLQELVVSKTDGEVP
jgi:hypothetical protein